MKPSSTILCLACCVTAGLTFAQDGDKKPGGPGGSKMAEFLKKIDTNADGKVTKEEFLEFSRKEGEDRFAKIDANNDGVADEAELKAAAEKMRGGGERRGGSEGGGFRRPPEGQGRPEGGPRPEGQGRPEGGRPEGGPRPEGQRRPEGGRPEGGPRPEGQGRPEGGRPEGGRPEGGPRPEGQGRPEGGPPGQAGGFPGMRGMMAAMGNPEEAFKKMDKNNDGTVDLAEYQAANAAELEGRFKGLDQNSDGKVSAEEFKGAMERIRGMMGRGGQGAPGGAGGFRRPGGDGAPGGASGGFRRPPSQDGDAPKPESK